MVQSREPNKEPTACTCLRWPAVEGVCDACIETGPINKCYCCLFANRRLEGQSNGGLFQCGDVRDCVRVCVRACVHACTRICGTLCLCACVQACERAFGLLGTMFCFSWRLPVPLPLFESHEFLLAAVWINMSHDFKCDQVRPVAAKQSQVLEESSD